MLGDCGIAYILRGIMFVMACIFMASLSLGMEFHGEDARKRNCTIEEVSEPSWAASRCYSRQYRQLYLTVNGLLLKSGPRVQSYSLVGKALGLSQQQNLSLIELKLLTDVIHYDVNKKPLLRSSYQETEKETTDTSDKNIVQLGSDILEERNMEKLKNLRQHFPVGERLLMDFEQFATKTVSTLQQREYRLKAQNIEFRAEQCPEHEDYSFSPTNHYDNDSRANSPYVDEITIPKGALIMNDSYCALTAFYYKTLQNILPSNKTWFENITNATKFLNSRIISLSVFKRTELNLSKHPVQIKLAHNRVGKFRSKGAFWNFTEGYNGYWSDAGCELKAQTKYHTTFECHHLTNFAILVTGKLNPDESLPQQNEALSIISSAGCFLSMIGEIGTLAVYAATRIRSKRRLILINTVLCLVLAQAVFLAGVRQARKEPVVCALVAASICYFFLAAFLWMLNMGIHLQIITSKLLSNHFPFWYFLLSAYVLPLVEIVLAAAITQGRAFGSDNFCWFSAEQGTIWIFLGPVTTIILVNLGITVLVLLRMLGTKKLQDARKSVKIRHVMRAVVILTPSLGLTWILGVFTMSTDDIILHFLFAIFNSLQGVFIFINCCLLDEKVRKELCGLIRHPSRLSRRDSLLKQIRFVRVGPAGNVHNQYGARESEK